MKAFKNGDRVNCYAYDGKKLASVVNDEPDKDGTIRIETEDGDRCYAHPKQLRHIKKKRVWWINYGPDYKSVFENPEGNYIRTTPPADKTGSICVKEGNSK